MALERSLEGPDQLLKLVKRQAREIQELHRAGLQLGEPYTCHGSCLLSLYGDVRGVSYQKESGINSVEEDACRPACGSAGADAALASGWGQSAEGLRALPGS